MSGLIFSHNGVTVREGDEVEVVIRSIANNWDGACVLSLDKGHHVIRPERPSVLSIKVTKTAIMPGDRVVCMNDKATSRQVVYTVLAIDGERVWMRSEGGSYYTSYMSLVQGVGT